MKAIIAIREEASKQESELKQITSTTAYARKIEKQIAARPKEEKEGVVHILSRECVSRVEAQKSYKRIAGLDNHLEEGIEQTYYHRPFLEALFFQNHARFKMLVDELLVSKSTSHINGFFENLKNTDLHVEKLLHWDLNDKNKLLREIDKFEIYMRSLTLESDQKAQNKGNLGIALAKKLKEDVNNEKLSTEKINNDSSYHSVNARQLYSLEILQFKLNILNDLHKHDKEFSVHRGWKRFVTNALTICLTAGIFNLIHYFATGQALFFAKTDTEYKVLNAQKTLGLHAQEEIQQISLKL